jgi:tRNA-splicing ligase RtcB
MTAHSTAAIHEWLVEKMPIDVRHAVDRIRSADDVAYLAVMPDVHRADDVCVGIALATRRLIYPAAVGGDIGCGMLAVAFHACGEVFQEETNARATLEALAGVIPCHKHPGASAPSKLPTSLLTEPLSDPRLDHERNRDGRVQLGTLGRGNHFVELQIDADERLWLMLHSGSRGMGQRISAHHVRNATATESGLLALDSQTAEGRAYLHDARWAVKYASESRLTMARATADVLHKLFKIEADWSTLIHGDHNHVRHEQHFGEMLFVHRKGALPASIDEAGVIPGSMGTYSFHVLGRGCEDALKSSSHGAGRAMRRSEARDRIPPRDLRRQLKNVWFDDRMTPDLCEEAPAAYKNVRQVMKAQRDLTKVIRELRPLLVYKGR